MTDSDLKSEYEEIKPVKEKTIPEYYLAKGKFFAEQGKEFWLVRLLTHHSPLNAFF